MLTAKDAIEVYKMGGATAFVIILLGLLIVAETAAFIAFVKHISDGTVGKDIYRDMCAIATGDLETIKADVKTLLLMKGN